MRSSAIQPLLLTVILFLFPGTASADWAYPFVVYSGNVYIVTDEIVAPDRVGESIGKVTQYSTREGTYSGNFSNVFPKGTRYFAITGIGVEQQIAVQAEDGRFVFADYGGKYEESKFDRITRAKGWIFTAIAAALAAAGMIFVARRKKQYE